MAGEKPSSGFDLPVRGASTLPTDDIIHRSAAEAAKMTPPPAATWNRRGDPRSPHHRRSTARRRRHRHRPFPSRRKNHRRRSRRRGRRRRVHLVVVVAHRDRHQARHRLHPSQLRLPTRAPPIKRRPASSGRQTVLSSRNTVERGRNARNTHTSRTRYPTDHRGTPNKASRPPLCLKNHLRFPRRLGPPVGTCRTPDP